MLQLYKKQLLTASFTHFTTIFHKSSFQYRCSMVDFASEITHVTYKEVAILWNMQPQSAANRLNLIRSILKKTRIQRLTVAQFCKAEDITIDEFNQAINRYYSQVQKKAS